MMRSNLANLLDSTMLAPLKMSLRAKLVASFLIVVLLIAGTTATSGGVGLIASGVIRQAEE